MSVSQYAAFSSSAPRLKGIHAGRIQAARLSASCAPQVHGVLFDMDGVLCESMGASVRSAQAVYQTLYNTAVTEEQLLRYAGTGEDPFIAGPHEELGLAGRFSMDAARSEYYAVYMAILEAEGSKIGMPGASALVADLKARGIRVAVASSADQIKVDANLKAAGIDPTVFDAIVCADTFDGPLKPAPDVFLTAAARIGVAPANAVVIEDAAAGVQAALAAGMRVIGVTTTMPRERMELEHPTAIFTDISAITAEDLLGLGSTSAASQAAPDAQVIA